MEQIDQNDAEYYRRKKKVDDELKLVEGYGLEVMILGAFFVVGIIYLFRWLFGVGIIHAFKQLFGW